MGVAKGKSVRFVKLVEESGNPERAVFWTAPEKDAGFMKAVKEGRVVSLREPNVGSKKEFGMVGFHKGLEMGFLVFPKKLELEAGTKIVGIKYELLTASAPVDPVAKIKPARKIKSVRKVPEKKVVPMFRVVLQGTKDFLVELTAENAAEAQRVALDWVKTKEGDVRTVEMVFKVKSTRKVSG